MEGRMHRMDTNRGILFIYACSSAREGRVHSGAAVLTPDAPQPCGPSRMRRRHGHGAGSSAHAGPEHLVLPPALPITQAARLLLWKTGRQCLTYILQALKPAHQRRPSNWGTTLCPQNIMHYRARRRARRSAAPETKSAAPASKAWTSTTAGIESSAVLGIAEVGAEGAGLTVSGVGAEVSPSEVPGISGLLVSSGV